MKNDLVVMISDMKDLNDIKGKLFKYSTPSGNSYIMLCQCANGEWAFIAMNGNRYFRSFELSSSTASLEENRKVLLRKVEHHFENGEMKYIGEFEDGDPRQFVEDAIKTRVYRVKRGEEICRILLDEGYHMDMQGNWNIPDAAPNGANLTFNNKMFKFCDAEYDMYDETVYKDFEESYKEIRLVDVRNSYGSYFVWKEQWLSEVK